MSQVLFLIAWMVVQFSISALIGSKLGRDGVGPWVALPLIFCTNVAVGAIFVGLALFFAKPL